MNEKVANEIRQSIAMSSPGGVGISQMLFSIPKQAIKTPLQVQTELQTQIKELESKFATMVKSQPSPAQTKVGGADPKQMEELKAMLKKQEADFTQRILSLEGSNRDLE